MSIWGRMKDDRGISAVLVVVCLFAIFGAAVLSVDAGQLWAARRNAVTATDASALAQARYYALNPPPLSTTTCTTGQWDTVLNANVNDLINSSCQVLNLGVNGNSGIVIVTALKRSPARFTGVLGIGDSAAYSMSAVSWGFVTQPLGLRPVALCLTDSNVADALNVGGEVSPPVSPNYVAPDGTKDYAGRTPGVVHHIQFDQQNTCSGGSSGNIGWVNLQTYYPCCGNMGTGHNPPQSYCANPATVDGSCGISDGLRYGWNGQVGLDSPTTCDADHYPPPQATSVTCAGQTGTKNSNSVKGALDFLMNPSAPTSNCGAGSTCQPATVPILIFDTIPTTNGSNATFHLAGIAMVRFWGYDMKGNGGYLELEFMNRLAEGACCQAAPPSAGGLKGTRICDVDHSAKSTVTQCAPT